MTPRCRQVCFAFLTVAFFAAGRAALFGNLADSTAERGQTLIELPRVERNFVDGPVEAFARGEGGVIFVGSHCLAIFDGAQWRRIEVPGSSGILALAASFEGRRIWVGAVGTFGYVERSPKGEWRFVSLNAQLVAAGGPDSDEVRFIFPSPRGVFFAGLAQIYYWDGIHMSAWSLPNPSRLFGVTDGERPFIYQPGVGLFTMDVAGPRLWLTEQSMPTTPPLVAMAVLRDGTQIALFDGGIFRRTDGHWFRLDGVSDFLKGKRARRLVALPNNTVAITTYGFGLVFGNADGSVRTVIGPERGLGDGMINGLWLDPTDQLWIGLNWGFARLAVNNEASLFDQHSHLFALGDNKMRLVLSFDGRPRVVTTNNVFSLTPASGTESANFSRGDFFWRALHDGTVFDEKLWLADISGLWRLPKGLGVREKISTAETFLLLVPRATPGVLLCFETNACNAWLCEAGTSSSVDLQQAFESLPVSAIEGSDGAVWLSTARGHIRKFTWDASTRSLKLIGDFSPGRGLPDGIIRPVLTSVDGAILAFTNKGIVVFDPVANAFLPASGLGELMGIAAATVGANGYWIAQAKRLQGAPALIKVAAPYASGRPFTYEPMLAPGLDQIGEVSSIGVTNSDSGEVLWVGGVKGVVRLETASLRQANPPPELMWQRVQTDTEGLAALLAGSHAVFKVGVRRVEFSFAPRIAAAAEGLLFYETRLENVEQQWSSPQLQGTREFTGLAPGRYTFAARAIDRFGQIGRPVKYMFFIEAPWYRQAWFPFVWLLPVALTFWGVHRLRLAKQAAQSTLRLELQTSERKRIARELHDTLLQGFIGVGLKLEAIATNLPESLAPVRDQLRKILDQSDRYLTEARRLVVELRSPTLEKGHDLSHALAVAIERLMDETEIELSYSVNGEQRKLASLIESNLLRIGEEGITNAVKHAHPAKVEVNLRFGANEVCLQIRDNGCGFEPQGPDAAKVGHFGLIGIQERVKAISGRLSLSSQPGSGTEIIVTVPTAIPRWPRGR